MGKAHAMHNASSSKQWLNCDLWFPFKVAAEEEGEDYNPEKPVTRRGTALHHVCERAGELHLWKAYPVDEAYEHAWKTKTRYIEGKYYKELSNDGEDEEQGLVAFRAMMDLLTPELASNCELELEVPLTHEPKSVGHVDLCAYEPKTLLVADYKFGEMAVSPNDSQLKLYAVNALTLLRANGIEFEKGMKVKLAVVQPRHHIEALVRVYDVVDILKFGAYVEGVVENQLNGYGLRGAGSLRTCEWCPFADRCGHRGQLVQNIMSSIHEPSPLTDTMIEEVVRSAGALKKVIEECSELVKKDENRFPNWTRVDVRNARQWSGVHDVQEIISRLHDMGAEGVYRLDTPKRVMDANPLLAKEIEAFVADESHHIRLYPGAPKGAPKEEPARRSTAKRSATKKSAKKAAKKSKKKSAKKAARRK